MHFVQAKGILSTNNGMNIYRGCSHGCIYCDSRSKCYGFTHPFEDIEGFVLSGFAEHGEPNLDYIIVLGAQVYENGPSVVLKFRLEEAIAYLEENPDTKCILSGGQGHNEPFVEAVGMADYLMKHGISEERLLLETESATTAQNISNSRKMIEQNASVGIVTNNFHVFRAVRIAEKQGMEKVCGIAADTTKLYLPNNMLREFFAVMKFLLFSPDIR